MRHLSPRTLSILALFKKPNGRKEVSIKLGLDIKIVTTICLRLEQAHHIERYSPNNMAYPGPAKFVITTSGKEMLKLGSGKVKDKPLPPSTKVYQRAYPSPGFSVAEDPRNVMTRDVYRSGDGQGCYYTTNIPRAK